MIVKNTKVVKEKRPRMAHLLKVIKKSNTVDLNDDKRSLESENSRYQLGRRVTRLGNLLDFGKVSKPLATINFPISPTFLGNFCKIVKTYHFSSEIIFGQLL